MNTNYFELWKNYSNLMVKLMNIILFIIISIKFINCREILYHHHQNEVINMKISKHSHFKTILTIGHPMIALKISFWSVWNSRIARWIKKALFEYFGKQWNIGARLQSPSLRGAICFSRRARNKNAYIRHVQDVPNSLEKNIINKF